MNKRGMKPQQAAKIRAKKGLKATKLQRLRVARGLSQNDLAAMTGISAGRISHYEQEIRRIDGARLDTLLAFCLALDCKLEDLVESKELIAKLRMTK